MKINQNLRVNTLIIGAGRSGTTSLCSALAAHPEISFSTIKEVNYFSIDRLFERGESYFHSFFEHTNQRVIATSDTYLLADYAAIQKIHEYNPDMKLIALLRDPVSRAYSSYNYSTNFGHHKKYNSFTDSIEIEKNFPDKMDIVEFNNLGHFHCSLYARHLSEWAAVFGKDQLLVLRTTDMINHPDKFASRITSFLGIEEYPFVFEKQNVNAVPRSKFLERMLISRNSIFRKAIRNLLPWKIKQKVFKSGLAEKFHNANRNPQKASVLSEEERLVALEFFRDDLRKLEKEFDITF